MTFAHPNPAGGMHNNDKVSRESKEGYLERAAGRVPSKLSFFRRLDAGGRVRVAKGCSLKRTQHAF